MIGKSRRKIASVPRIDMNNPIEILGPEHPAHTVAFGLGCDYAGWSEKHSAVPSLTAPLGRARRARRCSRQGAKVRYLMGRER